ncbi:MAG: anaerobic ribonucleoside-triphosphate reductase activating protein [Epulopiscium sp.]|nr:anaerobic ribonucleoside-triphosphate reductase activating protein [Candidatus Epulonipiscium sp.]
MKKLQVAGFLDNSTVNGSGLRSVLFLSGCFHNCPGCHNVDMQDINYGENIGINEIITRIKGNIPIIEGVTISGGEPFEQWENLLPLLQEIKKESLTCWVYTGYTYSEINSNKNFSKLLPWIDVLVEGPFKEDLLTNDLPYIGSTNQRILLLSRGNINRELHFN